MYEVPIIPAASAISESSSMSISAQCTSHLKMQIMKVYFLDCSSLHHHKQACKVKFIEP